MSFWVILEDVYTYVILPNVKVWIINVQLWTVDGYDDAKNRLNKLKPSTSTSLNSEELPCSFTWWKACFVRFCPLNCLSFAASAKGN